MSEKDLVRLQKIIARSGIASRREAERLIQDGLVCVDGQVITELGVKVSTEAEIRVRGKRVTSKALVYLCLNKPRGYVCSSEAHPQFPSFLDLFPKQFRHVHHVGRLDVASEGLLFATSDGAFTQIVTHPSFEIPKYYQVEVRGAVPGDFETRCCRGEYVDGELLRFKSVRKDSGHSSNRVYSVQLIGGKNREIRRLLAFLGLGVSRLCRIGIGGVKLADLRIGAWRHLSVEEIDSFLSCRRSE